MLSRRRFLRTAAAAAPALAVPLPAQHSDPPPDLPPAILALKDRSHEAVPNLVQ